LYNTVLKEQFYKNTRLIFAQKFKKKLRTIPASAEKQILKFSIKVVNKTVASATQFAKCNLLHTYLPGAARAQKIASYSFFNKLT